MTLERIKAEGGALWDNDTIEADINHVFNSRIAKKTCKNYKDYTMWLIIFLFDHREKFPALIPPGLVTKLEEAAVGDLHNFTRAGTIKKHRKYIRQVIVQSFQTIDPTDSPPMLTSMERTL